MIYAHHDMRYILHAFPNLYEEYWRRNEMVCGKWDKWESGQGWSFSSSAGGRAKDLELVCDWLHAQLECSI